MTEKSKVNKTYEKVRKKNSEVNDERIIKELAVKEEKRRSLWISIAFLWGCIACAILYYFLPVNDYTDVLIIGSVIAFIAFSFEYFRTVLNAEKITYHYFGEHKVKRQGVLTLSQIEKANKKEIRNKDADFKIIKANLFDKSDSDDSNISFIYHKYTLYFRSEKTIETYGFRVKRRVYLRAPMDAEYVLVISEGKVVAAYLSHAWEISPELSDKCDFNIQEHNETMRSIVGKTEVDSEKSNLLAEIILLSLNIAAWLLMIYLSILLGIIVLVFVTFFATKNAIEDKNTFSIINVVFGYCTIVFAVMSLLVL